MTHQRRMALGLLALAAVAFLLSRTFSAAPPAPDVAPSAAPPPVAAPSLPKPTPEGGDEAAP